MKVLVPLDGTELSEGMLHPARRLAPEGELLLVRVIDPKADSATAQAYLEGHQKRLEGEGVSVRWCLEEGDPAEQILIIAHERSPDYIVMATHGRQGNARKLAGSVAEEVLRKSESPIFMCNPKGIPLAREGEFARLLVAHDGSELADGILPRVTAFAKQFGSNVTLLQVLVERSSELVPPQGDLSRALETLEAAGIKAQTRVIEGVPAEAILQESVGFDLVCLTTHGRSGMSRYLFGSVAEEVARACTRPLLLHRPLS